MTKLSNQWTLRRIVWDFLHITDGTGKDFASIMLDRVINTYGTLLSGICAQCYDNSANMRGQYKGLQAIVLQKKKASSFLGTLLAPQLEACVVLQIVLAGQRNFLEYYIAFVQRFFSPWSN